ncbi:MAG TPA: outer membrane beta-barrel protein [Opitutales bacterium]|nr:outer membrane beta-barrel protein [Opitutales bacterium]
MTIKPLKRIVWMLLFLGGWTCAWAQWDMELPGMGMPEDWAQRVYAGATGGYMKSRDFDGGGGSAAVGYDLGRGHSLELEFNFWLEEGKKSTQSGYGPLQISQNGPVLPVQATLFMNSKVHFNQFPIFLNYRYTLPFTGEAWKMFSLFMGVGLGVNIIHWDQTTNIQVVDASNYSSVVGSASNQRSQTTAALAGQGFAGLGMQVTQQFSLLMRARVLGTQKFSFGGNAVPLASPQATTPLLQTSTVHWAIEGGALYKF